MTFLSNDSDTDHNKEGNTSTNMHKHLTHSMQLISMNSLLLLSNGGDSQNGANENSMTTDKESNH